MDELPSEILELILARLNLVDHICFGTVCTSWRRVAKDMPPIEKPLWLAPSSNPRRTASRFLSFFGIKSHSRRHCVGCFGGWLVMFYYLDGMFLINAALGACIDLPVLKTSSQPHGSLDFCLRFDVVHKVVLSSDPSSPAGFTAVATHDIGKLAFFRPEDPEWTIVSHSRDLIYKDIIFHKGKLHAVEFSRALAIFESGPGSEPTWPALPPIPRCRSSQCDIMYLVELCGNLLVAVGSKRGNKYKGQCWMHSFRVYEPDMRQSAWVEVPSLGDHVLFLHPMGSFALSAKEHPELKSNSIYFGDDDCLNWPPADMGIFSMDDNRVHRMHLCERLVLFFILSSYWAFLP